MTMVWCQELFRPGRGEPLIDPYKFMEKGETLSSRGVILAFHPALLIKARKLIDNARPARLSGWLYKCYEGTFQGRRVIIALPFPGSPAAVAALEVLIAMGGEVFIGVGRAGSITSKLRVGDILIPAWGLREEGASFHYIPSMNYVPKPDQELLEVLHANALKLIKGRRGRVVKGGIWTTDAIFRETRDKVIEYSAKGIHGVDMESTALMTVADYREARLAVIASISDELHPDGLWVKGFNTRRLKMTENLVVKAALETLSNSIS